MEGRTQDLASAGRHLERLMRGLPTALLLVAAVAPVAAQEPLKTYSDAFEQRIDRGQPRLRYDVRPSASDPSAYEVTLTVRNAPDTIRLRLPIWAPGAYRVANFARNVHDLVVRVDGSAIPVSREDSSSWTAVVPHGTTAQVGYTIRHPSTAAARSPNNRSFLRADGALIDGPQTYLYLDGYTRAPAHVHFELPGDWRIVTGLIPTSDPSTFAAPSYDVLIDSPVLAGPTLHVWRFEVDGLPHRAAWFALPGAASFDTAAFTSLTRRLVETARDIMGTLPYREYTFLFIDGTGGGLEHLNSTTIGVHSDMLARDVAASADVTAHEFFHLWNIKRIRPAVLGPFDYQHPVRTTDLWWSEGTTDFFAQEILRRSGVASETQARDALASTLQSFLSNPAHERVSPERSSWTAWDTPEVNGGYGISYYTQGALLGELLELELRDRTEFRRGMDDVERALFDRFAGSRGFTGEDLQQVVNEICGCDLEAFFAQHVSGAAPLDLAGPLALLGWRAIVDTAPAQDSAGRALPDLRIDALPYGGYGSAGGAAGTSPRIAVSDPASAWGRAGLVTGDQVRAINGMPITTPAELRGAIKTLRIGDRVTVDALRRGTMLRTTVTIGEYNRTSVRIAELTIVTERMRRMRRVWMTGRS